VKIAVRLEILDVRLETLDVRLETLDVRVEMMYGCVLIDAGAWERISAFDTI